jgi:branched-chain amino acid transport system permease protein
MSATRQPDQVKNRAPLYFALMLGLFAFEAATGGWNTALGLLNMGLISAIMALGVNIQWGYAGLFNTGIVGFVALGGLAPVLVSMPPVPGAFAAGGWRVMGALALAALVLYGAVQIKRRIKSRMMAPVLIAFLIVGFFVYRAVLDPGVAAIEAINPSGAGYLGGLGLPVLLSWPVGMVFAAMAAWAVGKISLGLRSDYLAIATLGIAQIIIFVLRNEEWLARGVKNVNGLPRPVPYEIDLQADPGFVETAASFGLDPVTGSTIFVKLCYAALFITVTLFVVYLSEKALKSPWGRMMRAIRDNETAASAMGKDVTRRHLQVFILGSAVCGLAGAMMITLDGQMTPGSYIPLRFTFLIWVMVIVGGSGNNWGAVLGGMLIWFLWIKVEPWGNGLIHFLTSGLSDGGLKSHLLASAAHMRMLTMGAVLLLVLRFAPRGLLPEK